MSVVLPAPLGPTRPTRCPAGMVSAKAFTTLRARSAFSLESASYAKAICSKRIAPRVTRSSGAPGRSTMVAGTMSVSMLASRAELVVELGNPLPEVVRRLQQGARERGDHHEIARADQAVHPGVERAADEHDPHRDVHDVLDAAEPDHRAVRSAAAVPLLSRISLQLLVLERLIREEEDVADVREHVDDAAGDRRPRLVVRDGAPRAFAADEQAHGEVHDDRRKRRGAKNSALAT